MNILFDFDTVVCDMGSSARNDSSCTGTVLPNKGFVYALRALEKMGLTYAFFTRMDPSCEDLCLSFSEKRLFSLMPSCSSFTGMVFGAAPLADVLVTADEELIESMGMPAIYWGNGKKVISGIRLYLMDCCTQIPSLISDITADLY